MVKLLFPKGSERMSHKAYRFLCLARDSKTHLYLKKK